MLITRSVFDWYDLAVNTEQSATDQVELGCLGAMWLVLSMTITGTPALIKQLVWPSAKTPMALGPYRRARHHAQLTRRQLRLLAAYYLFWVTLLPGLFATWAIWVGLETPFWLACVAPVWLVFTWLAQWSCLKLQSSFMRLATRPASRGSSSEEV